MEWKTTVNSWLKTSIAWPTKRFYGRFAQKPDGFLNPVGPVPQPAEQTSSTRAKLWFPVTLAKPFHLPAASSFKKSPQKSSTKTSQRSLEKHPKPTSTTSAAEEVMKKFQPREKTSPPSQNSLWFPTFQGGKVSALRSRESRCSWKQNCMKVTEIGRIPVICCLNAVCGRWCMLVLRHMDLYRLPTNIPHSLSNSGRVSTSRVPPILQYIPKKYSQGAITRIEKSV